MNNEAAFAVKTGIIILGGGLVWLHFLPFPNCLFLVCYLTVASGEAPHL
jgi:hypothetical protein